MTTRIEKQKTAFDSLKDGLGYTNIMETPTLEKVVVSVGVGSVQDKKKLELIADRLAQITGQKASVKKARQSIASFKVREGDVSGYMVTLRGKRMNDFVTKLINIALPRTKDFRGVSRGSIDEMGNYTLGIKEHTIFPETSDEELKDVFGIAITFVTTATTQKEAVAYLSHLGLPFEKSEE